MMRLVVLAMSFTLAVSFVSAAADERRVTNASNVRLRSAPATTAPIVAELPLGSELVAVAHTNGTEPWYHVKTDDGRDGWVLGSLTTAIDPGQKEKTIASIVEARLRSGGNQSAKYQLFELIERTAARSGDREARARFALYGLRLLSDVAEGVPLGDRPVGPWLDAHMEIFVHNDPAGAWMVDPDFVQVVHGTHRGTAAADDIAWFFVTNGQLAECEGNVPCYVEREYGRNGWYLTEHPHGRHVDESTANIARDLNDVMDNFRRFPAVLAEFDPKTRCGELHAWLDPLTAAVTASTSTKNTEALTALGRFAKLCE